MLVSFDAIFSAPRPGFVLEAKKRAPKPPEGGKPASGGEEAGVSAAKARAAKAVKAAADANAAKKASQSKRAASIAKRRKEAMKRAAERDREMRRKRKDALKKRSEKRAGSVAKAKAKDKAGQVNAQLSHCVLALHYKRKKSVRGAWNICRASLTKYGYLKGPYKEDGKLKDVKQTQKGAKRAMQHAMEKHPLNGGIKGSPGEKANKFRNIFRDIEPTV